MFTIYGKKISENKKIRQALIEIYGIGFNKANTLCNKFNWPLNKKISDLSQIERTLLSKYIKQNIKIESELKMILKDNLKKYLTNKSIKGFRLRNKLPVNGQRTHSNAKTCRKKNF